MRRERSARDRQRGVRVRFQRIGVRASVRRFLCRLLELAACDRHDVAVLHGVVRGIGERTAVDRCCASRIVLDGVEPARERTAVDDKRQLVLGGSDLALVCRLIGVVKIAADNKAGSGVLGRNGDLTRLVLTDRHIAVVLDDVAARLCAASECAAHKHSRAIVEYSHRLVFRRLDRARARDGKRAVVGDGMLIRRIRQRATVQIKRDILVCTNRYALGNICK